ncbi:SGNH/GDSL hydrolase family protein [Niabella aurantiaca]|uniref:SGNH/GDSL hydrolase family protein n=1 Tax=Niabella aurantiaca TaxID=379900 RepID=UPI00035C5B9F|nr:SGNH/GDSL hydrolase family protein [Niabella aurantiaca]
MGIKQYQFCKMVLGLVLLFITAGGNAQTASDADKIAASQSGASPLLFNASIKEIPLISGGSFFNPAECTVRKGLPTFFRKLDGRKPVTVAFIGGSITQGNYCYRLQTAKYLQTTYARVPFTWINAGVSGTGTDLGAFRLKEQVLAFRPDLIFIEFAVNGAYQDGMEGMIQQVIKNNPETDICLVYTILTGQTRFYQEGTVPENIRRLEKLADHYGLPSVHLGMEAATLEKEGRLVWKGAQEEAGKILFSNDGIHPLRAGGNLYAAAIARGFAKMENQKEPFRHVLKAPLITAVWENARMYDPKDIATFDSHWKMINTGDSPFLKKFSNWFKDVAYAESAGASFSFSFKGDLFGFFDIGGPEVGQLEFEIDGKPVQLVKRTIPGFTCYEASGSGGDKALNRFNVYCNNRYRGQHDLILLKPGVHHVTVRISREKADKKSILIAARSEDIDRNPEKYDRTAVYIGRILLRGKPLK